MKNIKLKKKLVITQYNDIKTTSDLLKNPFILEKIVNLLEDSNIAIRGFDPDKVINFSDSKIKDIKKFTPSKSNKCDFLITETNRNGEYINSELALLEKFGLIKVDWKSIFKDKKPLRSRRFQYRIINKKGLEKINKLKNGENNEYDLSCLATIAKSIAEFVDDNSLDEFLISCGVSQKILDQFSSLTCSLEPWYVIYKLLIIFSSSKSAKDKKIFNAIIDRVGMPQFHDFDIDKAKKFKIKLHEAVEMIKKSNNPDKKTKIIIHPQKGVRRGDINRLDWVYPISEKRKTILFALKDGNYVGVSIIVDLVNQKKDAVSASIANINKLFQENLHINSKLILHDTNLGYRLNNDDFDINFEE